MNRKKLEINTEEDKKNPFKNCKLDREKHAKTLLTIIENHNDGFVLAINNKWGTGKTTFVKMFKQLLSENEGYKTLYYNAWENDFGDSPLISILGELKALFGENKSAEFKSITEKAFTIGKKVLPSIANALSKKYIGEEFADIIKESSESSLEVFNKLVDDYLIKKDSIVEFKSRLIKFLNDSENQKPIIFIIDELDRCKPSFSVEVLENIKHFFSIEKIIFIFSIDKIQLGNAIKGYYGSEQIDSEEYLRRFIDIEFNLPEPNIENYNKYLYSIFEFDKIFAHESKHSSHDLIVEKFTFLDISSDLFIKFNLTLRQIEKIYTHTNIVLNFFEKNEYIFPDILFSLIIIKFIKPELYYLIKTKQIKISELEVLLFDILYNNTTSTTKSKTVKIISTILFRYNNLFKYEEKIKFVSEEDRNSILYNLNEKYLNEENTTLFNKVIIESKNSRFDGYDILFWINKISLYEANLKF